jgi:hypothetical protein
MKKILIVLAAVLGMLLTGSAEATTLVVTSGFAATGPVPFYDGPFRVSGADFTLSAIASEFFPSIGDGTEFAGLPFADLVHQGVVYPECDSPLCAGSGLTFTHPVIVPPAYNIFGGEVPDWTAPLTPFAMTGDLIVPDPLTNEPVHFDLTGQGHLSTFWITESLGDCDCGPPFYTLAARYNFAPVPEPPTLMLLVTGLAAVGWRYRGGGRR